MSSISCFQTLPQPSRAVISMQPAIPRSGYLVEEVIWGLAAPTWFHHSILLHAEQKKDYVYTTMEGKGYHFCSTFGF